MSKDSDSVLDTVVRNGKACKFMLLSQGPEVLSVLAYRKGSDASRLTEIKKFGKGKVSCGVIDGKGAALSFKLRQSDGYEVPPVENSKLKKFLNEETGRKLMPTIDIVDTLPEVEMEEDDHQQGNPQGGWPPHTSAPQVLGSAQGTRYRSGDQWRAILTAIQLETRAAERSQLLTRAARDLNAENELVGEDLQADYNSRTALEQRDLLVKVSGILKKLAGLGAALPTHQPPAGTFPERPSTAAPPSPSSLSEGLQSGQPSASRSKQPSLFERAKHQLKHVGLDAKSLAAYEEIRCSSALDTVGLAIGRLSQENPQSGGPQVAEFTRQYEDLKSKLQQLWESPLARPKDIGLVREAAEVLEQHVHEYVDQFAGCQQRLHEFSQQLRHVMDSLQDARDQATREKQGEDRIRILDSYIPLLVAAQESYDVAMREFNSTGELGPVALQSLAEQSKNLELPSLISVIPVSAGLLVRRAALLQRAETDPESDAARIAEAMGGTGMLGSYASQIVLREQELGINLSRMASPGQTLSDEEMIALYYYSDNHYEKMNGLLLFPNNYEDMPEKAKNIRTLNEFCVRGLAKLPAYPSVCYPVMRFESGDYEWEKIFVEGQTFFNKQFWSTGATTGVFTKNFKKAVLSFRVYGKTGKDIAAFAKNPEGRTESSIPQLAALGKGEVLFAPNTPFKVMAVTSRKQQIGGMPTFDITLAEE